MDFYHNLTSQPIYHSVMYVKQGIGDVCISMLINKITVPDETLLNARSNEWDYPWPTMALWTCHLLVHSRKEDFGL